MRKGVSRIVLGRPIGRALVYLRTIGLWRCFRNLVLGIPTDAAYSPTSERQSTTYSISKIGMSVHKRICFADGRVDASAGEPGKKQLWG